MSKKPREVQLPKSRVIGQEDLFIIMEPVPTMDPKDIPDIGENDGGNSSGEGKEQN